MTDSVQAPLISASELADRAEQTTLLDVRYRLGDPTGHEQYLAGHLPGAVYVDLDTALAGPPGPGGRHPLPALPVLQDALRRSGVSEDRPVVVYDDWLGHAAARAWWLLRWAGHGDVRLLDGGWAAWQESGLPTAVGEVSVPAGDFTVRAGAMPVVTAEEVPGVEVLVDARAPERYQGEVEPIDPVAGHIPGAVNVPTARNLGADGRFLPAETLAATYAEVGAVPGAVVAAYCGSGITAAHDVLALEIAGAPAALYPGSWSEWITDPARPVATG